MLGDAVLGFLIAERLFELFPAAPEGVLTRLRASLVDEEALARQARVLGLGELLSLGKGEERTGGRERPSVLADAFEAVLAALYRSEGLEFVAALVKALFESEALERGSAAPQPADYKTALQERTQASWKSQPTYTIVSATGPDHARQFVAEAHLGKTFAGRGEGRSKKVAEQNAAKSALERWDELMRLVGQHETIADRSRGD